jgi:hypothetical protein
MNGFRIEYDSQKTVLEKATGWHIGDKDCTDDRLGRLAEVLGEDDQGHYDYQTRMVQHIICAYQLPTEIAGCPKSAGGRGL